MYAPSEPEYLRSWMLLKERSGKVSSLFNEYLENNWNSCREMWANHGRRRFFTAANTTNNRLEATWKQMKTMLNLNVSIDQCLASILQYQNNTLAALRRDLVEKQAKPGFDLDEPEQLAEVGGVLSKFGYKHVRGVFMSYLKQRKGFGAGCHKPTSVEVATNGKTYLVTLTPASCSCSSYQESHLLCVHLCFAALDVKKWSEIPAALLAPRWDFSSAGGMIRCLRETVATNNKLRRYLKGENLLRGLRNPMTEVPGSYSSRNRKPRAVYTKLKKNARSSEGTLVRSDVQKYNIVMATLKPVIDKLVQSSTLEFYPRMRLLETAADGLLQVLPSITGTCEAFTKDKSAEEGTDPYVTRLLKQTQNVARDLMSSSVESVVTLPEAPELKVAVPSSVALPAPLSSSVAPTTTLPSSVAHGTTQLKPSFAEGGPEPSFQCCDRDNKMCKTDQQRQATANSSDRSSNESDTPITAYKDVSQTPINPLEVKKLEQTGFLMVLRLPPPIHAGKKNNQRKSTKKLALPRTEVVLAIEDWNKGVSINDIAHWLQFSRNQDMVAVIFQQTPVVLSSMADISRKVIVADDDGSSENCLGVVFREL